MEASLRSEGAVRREVAPRGRSPYRIVGQDSAASKCMKPVSRYMVRHATALAREINTKAVLVLADAIESDDELRQLLRAVENGGGGRPKLVALGW